MTAPGRKDRHSSRHIRPLGASMILPPEKELFGDSVKRTVEPAVETLRTMLDCGRCYTDAPQAEVRAGTFDGTCTKKHNRSKENP